VNTSADYIVIDFNDAEKNEALAIADSAGYIDA
jgi:hypothetical protein